MASVVFTQVSYYANEILEEPLPPKRLIERKVITATKQLPSKIEMITPELEKSINEREYRIHLKPALVRKKLVASWNRCQALQTNGCKYFSLQERFRAISSCETLQIPPGFVHKTSKEIKYVGYAQTKADREMMEDCVLIALCSFKARGKVESAEIMAVFDGHGGDEVAIHAEKQFAQFLTARLTEYCKKGVSQTAIWNALKISFVDTSRSIYSEEAGSTASVCVRFGNKLYSANAGDSRLILITPEGKALSLSEDGSLAVEHFARRIINRGARIEVVAASRYKVSPVIPDGITVDNAGGIGENCFGNSARPKIVSYTLPDDPTGYILLIASDGLWDVASSDDVAACVHAARDNSAETISAVVCARAFNTSGHDNISVVVAKL